MREKQTYVQRLEDRESEYQRINLENSELKHKLNLQEDQNRNIHISFEKISTTKNELEVLVRNLQQEIDLYREREQEWQ